MATNKFSLFSSICCLLLVGSLVHGSTTPRVEVSGARPEPRIINRVVIDPNSTPASRESFMQRIIAKIKGPSTTLKPQVAQSPILTTHAVNPLLRTPLFLQIYQGPPHFGYQHPTPSNLTPFTRKEKSERDPGVTTAIPTATSVSPHIPLSTEKTEVPKRFHRGPQQESDTLTIPILRSDEGILRKEEESQVGHNQPRCYVKVPQRQNFQFLNHGFPQKYGSPFGHGQHPFFPGPFGNILFPLPIYPRYPTIIFNIPQKETVQKEPFDLIAMEKNKVVLHAPFPTAPPKTQAGYESEIVKVTPDLSAKDYEVTPLPVPSTTVSSIEELMEVDINPVSKLMNLLSGNSQNGPEMDDFANLPTQAPIETPKESEISSPKPPSTTGFLLKTVNEEENTARGNSTVEEPPKFRKFKW